MSHALARYCPGKSPPLCRCSQPEECCLKPFLLSPPFRHSLLTWTDDDVAGGRGGSTGAGARAGEFWFSIFGCTGFEGSGKVFAVHSTIITARGSPTSIV